MSAESDALKGQEARLGAMEKKLDNIGQDIRELRVALVGEPNSDKPSILLRLDRLEQSEKMKSKVIWAIIGIGGPSILGLIIERMR